MKQENGGIIMRVPKERTIFSNYDFPDEKEIVEWIASNGYPEDEIDEEMITDWSYMRLEQDWEDIKDEMKRFFNKKRILLFGSIGRWNGVVNGFSTYDDFMKMFYDATEDCDYWKFYDENGHLYLTCSHHDGTCSYEIKELSDDGYEYLERWNYSGSNDKRKSNDIGSQLVKRYSTLPNYVHKEYGCKRIEYEPQTKEALIRKLNNQARSFYC